MATGQPAAGGGRWVEVAPERITRWLAGFGERHGGVTSVEPEPAIVRFLGADGALAECHVPFPPQELPDRPDADPDAAGAAETVAAALASHAERARRVGVLLVRLGGYAVGVFEGERLVVSKVGARPVHGRSAAGGQSQQRFQRRRDKQAREALEAAADIAARVLGPWVDPQAPPARRLDGVVLGGDRRAIDGLRDDPRLAGVFRLEYERFLPVPDPKLAVLAGTSRLFRAVRIRLVEPSP